MGYVLTPLISHISAFHAQQICSASARCGSANCLQIQRKVTTGQSIMGSIYCNLKIKMNTDWSLPIAHSGWGCTQQLETCIYSHNEPNFFSGLLAWIRRKAYSAGKSWNRSLKVEISYIKMVREVLSKLNVWVKKCTKIVTIFLIHKYAGASRGLLSSRFILLLAIGAAFLTEVTCSLLVVIGPKRVAHIVKAVEISSLFEAADDKLGIRCLRYPSAQHVGGWLSFPSWTQVVIPLGLSLHVTPLHVALERNVDRDVVRLQHRGQATWDESNVCAELLHSEMFGTKL